MTENSNGSTLYTDSNYLRKLIDFLELNTANVEVDGDSGSSPISVVKHSKKRYNEEKHTGDGFDRVFCVFDKDVHESYTRAIDEVEKAKPINIFKAITSVPCFEYWLLLHYEFTTKPFVVTGSKSACATLIACLKQYFPAYSKGNANTYNEVKSQTTDAIHRSKRVLKQAQESGGDNPVTLMHELVEYLHHLKD